MKIIKSIIKRDPIFITLAYIAFIWIILIGTVLFGAKSIRKSYSIISLVVTIVLTSVPMLHSILKCNLFKFDKNKLVE